MFSETSPKELFVNITVFILLLLIEALPAIVRLKLEDSKYLQKIVHHKQMRDKADAEVEAIENQVFSMNNVENWDSEIEKVRLWRTLEEASSNGFKDTDELIKLAKSYKEQMNNIERSESNQSDKSPPLPNMPKEDPKKKDKDDDEFIDFEYAA